MVVCRPGAETKPVGDGLDPEPPTLKHAVDGPAVGRRVPSAAGDPGFDTTDAGPVAQQDAGFRFRHDMTSSRTDASIMQAAMNRAGHATQPEVSKLTEARMAAPVTKTRVHRWSRALASIAITSCYLDREGCAGPSHGADETGVVRGFGRTLLVRCAETVTPTNPSRTNSVARTARTVVIKAPPADGSMNPRQTRRQTLPPPVVIAPRLAVHTWS